jgi:hypothetical protein
MAYALALTVPLSGLAPAMTVSVRLVVNQIQGLLPVPP